MSKDKLKLLVSSPHLMKIQGDVDLLLLFFRLHEATLGFIQKTVKKEWLKYLPSI